MERVLLRLGPRRNGCCGRCLLEKDGQAARPSRRRRRARPDSTRGGEPGRGAVSGREPGGPADSRLLGVLRARCRRRDRLLADRGDDVGQHRPAAAIRQPSRSRRRAARPRRRRRDARDGCPSRPGRGSRAGDADGAGQADRHAQAGRVLGRRTRGGAPGSSWSARRSSTRPMPRRSGSTSRSRCRRAAKRRPWTR